MGKLEYGIEELAGGVVPGVGRNNRGERSWHSVGKGRWEGCALVRPAGHRGGTLLYGSSQ